MGAVAERLCSGVAAAAEEDRHLLGISYAATADIDDPDWTLDQVPTVVGGCDLAFGNGLLLFGSDAGNGPGVRALSP